MYTVGNGLKISLFGRSHADCIGCVIEGLPMGMPIDADHISASRLSPLTTASIRSF